MTLKLDWCTHEAAKYAVLHWHYSKKLPTGKNNYIGAWEDDTFIGVVIFGTGASSNLGAPYGLKWNECCELVRVALGSHKVQVSKIISIAMRLLKQRNPELRLCVSFADPYQSHIGTIYQAANWLFCGNSNKSEIYQLPNGELVHPRRYTGTGWNAPKPIPTNAVKIITPGKYRYLYPLDDDMRRQIEPLRKPYPKRADSVNSSTAGVQPDGGGANPTSALLETEAADG